MKRFINLLLLLAFTALLFSCQQEKELTPEEVEQQQIEAIIKLHEEISPVADKALSSANPVEELKKVAEQFKDRPEIEDIYFERDKLALKYEHGGYVYWLIIPESEQVDTKVAMEQIDKLKQSLPTTRSGKKKEYPKTLYIYTHTLDESRKTNNNGIKSFIEETQNEGYNITPVYGEGLNVDFLKESLKGYDAIFLDSHGCFDEKAGLTAIQTGEKAPFFITKLYLQLKNKEYRELWKNDLLVVMGGKYIGISQKFIEKYYKKGDFPSNSFFYSGCCQTMMDSENRFAKELNKAGISKIVGYNESTMASCAILNAMHLLVGLADFGSSYNEILSEFINAMHFIETGKGTKRYKATFTNETKGVFRQFVYDHNMNFKYSADITSYPADVDFRFPILKLEKHELEMIIGNTEEIKISGEGSGKYKLTEDVANIVQATAEKDKIIVKAVNTGECNLTITDEENGIKEVCKIKVKPRLKLEKHELELISGNTGEIKIISEGSGNYKLTANVAGIIQATAQKDKIIVKGVNPGECNLTVTDEGTGVKEVCKIKVKPRLRLEKHELEMISGNMEEVRFAGKGSGNYTLTTSVTGIVQATAGKDRITIRAVNPGECTLTITDVETGIQEACKIKVKPRQIKKLKLERYDLEMISGNTEEVRFASEGSGNYTLTPDVTGIVQATAGKDRITIRAVNPGKCNLTVTDVETGIKEVCKISVKTHQQKIDEIIPAEFVDKLKELDVPFHEGKNPPIINGCYLISPCVLAKTNIQRDFAIGHRFSDHTIRFYDQDNKTLRIKIEEWQANSKSNSIETSVTAGTGNKFTVYGKVKTVKMNNPAIYTVLGIVYSGEFGNGSIKNSHYAFVMLEKNDPNNEYIAVGKARVVIDQDGVSPTTAIPTTKSSTRTSVERSLIPFILRKSAEKRPN
ncbi:hypothetical protein [Bacteroides heparinolyticus]|uniref:hypothetical protein n=2 Tax=Prevotella heparinolytica TaxID=28113 RepID=UPI0035A1BDDA